MSRTDVPSFDWRPIVGSIFPYPIVETNVAILVGPVRQAFTKTSINLYSEVWFLQGRWICKANWIIYMWVGHRTTNSFCDKIFDHLKMTQLHSPLNCLLYQTYGPCWSSVSLVREWVKGVSINCHGLRTVGPSVDEDLANFRRLSFW